MKDQTPFDKKIFKDKVNLKLQPVDLCHVFRLKWLEEFASRRFSDKSTFQGNRCFLKADANMLDLNCREGGRGKEREGGREGEREGKWRTEEQQQSRIERFLKALKPDVNLRRIYIQQWWVP